MGTRDAGAVVKGFHTLFSVGTTFALTDPELLERFVGGPSEAAEAAFTALVERHGPLVLRVCRGQLRDAHAAEDAFQATFLVLAKKARSIRTRGSLASWLFGVARRVARQACRDRVRRHEREQRGAIMAAEAACAGEPPLLLPEIQEEVDRLPEKYRSAVVLCYLEGLTHEEAASQLRIPLGTVKVRLARARERLRGRLVRRGLAPGVLVAALAAEARAALPAPLVEATIRAATQVAAGQAAAVSGSVAALVTGALRAMLYAKLRVTAACLAASLCVMASTLLVVASLPRPARSAQAQAAEGPQAAAERPLLTEVNLSRDAPVKVAVETLKKSRFAVSTSQPATVHPFAEFDVYAGVPGFLRGQQVEIGDKVKRGQVLETIDAPELEALVTKSRAVVLRAEAQLHKAQAAEEALPQDVVKAVREAAQAEIVAAQAELQVAKADLNVAESRRELTKITSPIDGVVTVRNFTVGSFVRGGAENGARPLLTVVQTGKMRVVVQVPDRDVPLLEIGDPASVVIDSLGSRSYKGKVSRMAYAEDPATRTMRVEIDLDNADGKLRPGQYGVVTIELEDLGERLTVPASAVRETPEGRASCFRVVDGRAALTQITLGKESDGRFEVVDGLREGDTIVAQPGGDLKEGQAVEPAGNPGKARR